MRSNVQEKVITCVEKEKTQGKILEVGAYKLDQSAINLFPGPRFEYFNLDIEKGDMPNTIVADLTRCPEIKKNTFDLVLCADVFEHLSEPWLAAKEVSRILKPGGLAMIFTVWSWRYHPLPIDYWRFSPECLQFLFKELECLEANFDISHRRDDIRGFWENKKDYVPIDELGGWRENWSVYYIGRKKKRSFMGL
jgi:SAM-dependent methyltransferase